MTGSMRADQPQDGMVFADYFDGITAVARRVRLDLGDDQLRLVPVESDPITWPCADIRSIPDQASGTELILALAGDPVSRLVVRDAYLSRDLSRRCRNLHRRPPARGIGKLALWSVAAIASVALIISVLVPVMANQLAEFLPPEGEQALGDTTFEQIRSALTDNDFAPLAICDDPKGVAALEMMKHRLTEGLDLPYPVKVHVLDDPLINAFALPGGRVVFFRGLIDAADHPDEVAAVFAHEIGHVVHRDPVRIALRSAGSIGVLGLLLGDFAGGFVVLFLTERLIEATYSREAEAAADRFAHGQLAASGIPPSALGDMFQRLLDEHGDEAGLIAHFTSHPALGDRIASAQAADSSLNGALRPSLGEADWQALRRICN